MNTRIMTPPAITRRWALPLVATLALSAAAGIGAQASAQDQGAAHGTGYGAVLDIGEYVADVKASWAQYRADNGLF